MSRNGLWLAELAILSSLLLSLAIKLLQSLHQLLLLLPFSPTCITFLVCFHFISFTIFVFLFPLPSPSFALSSPLSFFFFAILFLGRERRKMPLVRFEVRNEYGLGQPELYKEADKEDPKAVLDGVAVAGLVGILRQLGDLAEFAAEVFHGLQDQAVTTASRSHKLMVRVQKMEAALPSLEKAVLAQSSHIHFAYTAGSEWHPRIQNEQNHFIYSDLPRFIMDSYEECRDPPHLHLLDKFDTGGPGSCLRRYSDPTFFRKVLGNFKEPDMGKFRRDKKTHKSRKKGSLQRNGDLLHRASMENHGGRMQFAPPIVSTQQSPSHTASTTDMTLKSDLGDRSNSFDSRTGSGYEECAFHLNSSLQPGGDSPEELSSKFIQHNNILKSRFTNGQPGVAEGDVPRDLLIEQITVSSSCDTWDEKVEIVKPKGQHCDEEEAPGILTTDFDLCTQERSMASRLHPNQTDDLRDENHMKLRASLNEHEEVGSELDYYMDALNTIESESENDVECETKNEVDLAFSDFSNGGTEDERKELLEDISVCFLSQAESHMSSDISHKALSDFNNSGKGDKTRDLIAGVSGCFLSKAESHTSSDISHDALTDLNNGGRKDGTQELIADISGHFLPKAEFHTSSDVLHSEMPCDMFKSILSKGSTNQEPTSNPEVVDVLSHEDISHVSGHIPSNNEHHASLEKEEIPCEPPSSFPLKYYTDIQTPKVSGTSSNVDHSLVSEGYMSVDSLDGSKIQSIVDAHSSCGLEDSNLPESSRNVTTRSSCMSRETQGELSHVGSVTFWTNGGLLGLQPSKPPDFTTASIGCQGSLSSSKGEALGPLNYMSNMDGERGKLGRLVKDGSIDNIPSSICSTSLHADQDVIVENSGDSNYSDKFHFNRGILNISSAAEDKPSSSEDMRSTSMGASEGISSQSIGLDQRLLINSFSRKISLVTDGKSELPSLQKIGVLDQRNLHSDISSQTQEQSFDEQFESRLFADSFTTSPPLEHMKISFHPFDSVEVSRMKLKFPDENHNESFRDMFTNFQLVPEPGRLVVGHDSDDDTFCRSSPYISDDYLSHNSDSDFENWGFSESPDCKNMELYDAMLQMSSVESVPSALPPSESGNEGVHKDTGFNSIYTKNGLDSSLSSSLIDIPGFETVNHLPQREEKDNSDEMNVLEGQHPGDSNPLPPPPPPVQWQTLKTHPDLTKDRHHSLPEADQHAFNPKLLESALRQQLKAAPANGKQLVEDDIAFKSKNKQEQVQEQLNSTKEANVPSNGRGVDETDLLQQIRAKSFTLRHTVTTMPTLTSSSNANEKVTAILEKANAIRQAVGSDDDSWSDD
ncbi:hypothetical protein K2173_000766 [Erythroxylum novogranatense]|uniref:Protein SCAR n=1 Tax=Erythroxylum novogranatense TaxID=1862640 RepID=A0AAV8T333_9ROSI|nr:hypothetical protein K2173_000766 [Erythroxylum novogranatense]